MILFVVFVSLLQIALPHLFVFTHDVLGNRVVGVKKMQCIDMFMPQIAGTVNNDVAIVRDVAFIVSVLVVLLSCRGS